MAKMTISQLATFTSSYVDKAKQAGAWNKTSDNFVGLVDKVGKQVTIAGNFQDKLPELDGDELPLGKTIEEFYISLTLPEAFTNVTTEGAKDVVPQIPSVESVVYSYTLGRKKIKTTTPMDNVERACIDSTAAGNVIGQIMERFANSISLTRYAVKKQLLGNAADKACGVSGCYAEIAVPVDDSTGEAFIKQIKSDVEDASFAHEGGLGQALIGAAEGLTLYVKKGVMPSLEVDTLAGAFNKDELALPCRIKVVDDFGTMTNSSVYALLVDDRAIRLHNGYKAVRSSENADGDFINSVYHFEDTGFISKYCYIKAYKA